MEKKLAYMHIAHNHGKRLRINEGAKSYSKQT